MKYMENMVRNASWVSLGISIAVVLLFGAAMVQGASTISTNISTGGTLSVTGASTLTGAVSAAGAVYASSTLQATGAARFYADSTFDGGIDAVTLTHSNSATSSITVGCIDTYATSTDSAIKLMFTASTTASANYGGGTSQGFVLWGFGSCS